MVLCACFGRVHFITKKEDVYHLVVHGGVIRALLVAYAPTEQPYWSYQTPHDKIFFFDVYKKGLGGGSKMRVFIGGAYSGKTDYVMKLLADQNVELMDGTLPNGTPYP